MFKSRAVFVVCSLALGIPGTAHAQDVPLARILVDFFTEAVRMTSGTGSPGNPHEVHFLPGLSQQAAPFELQKALVTQLSTFPLGTSSGGFTYTLDPSTGAITPGSPSFGPSFAERALTIGRGKVNAGVQYQHVAYDSFEDVPLEGEQIGFILQHNDCCPAGANNPTAAGNTLPFFEGDLVETRLSLNVKTDTTVAFANVGITNALEVGVAVPFVRTDLQVGGRSTILRVSTADPSQALIHSWDGAGATVKNLPVRGGSASGIGDVLVRGKYAFVPGALAAEVDFRLPTGDEEQLLGTGGLQTRVMLIAGASRYSFAPHVNIGYVFANGSVSSDVTDLHVPDVVGGPAIANISDPNIDLSVPDEFMYTAGFDWSASRRVTFAADMIGRTLRDMTRFETSESSFPFRTSDAAPVQTTRRSQLNITGRKNLNLLLGAVGAKINVATNLLLTANVLFPLSDGGLRPKITPVVGLDYAF
jgi:hypothetical protein